MKEFCNMKELERQLKALANGRRLAIVKFLQKRGPVSVGEIAKEIKLSLKSTSRHLAVLSSADILQKQQRDLYVFYFLSKSQHPIAKSVISMC